MQCFPVGVASFVRLLLFGHEELLVVLEEVEVVAVGEVSASQTRKRKGRIVGLCRG